jgi:predicted enzyme related to lactoylglutathione lyase
MIKGMAFVAYSVSDVARATAFYQDVVGLKQAGLASDYWVEFDAGETTFGVGRGEGLGVAPGTAFSAAFEVDDLVSLRDRLVTRGVKVTEIREGPVCESCFATDPDGNRFALHQRKA